MKCKILYTDVYYPRFLTEVYRHNPEVSGIPYARQLKFLHSQLFGTADFYTRNLIRLGYETESLILNAMPLQTSWARENNLPDLSLKDHTLGRIPYLRGRFKPDWVKRIFMAQVKKFHPRVLFMQDICFLPPELLLELKPQIPLIIGQIASRLPQPEYFRPYDLILTSLPNLADRIRELGTSCQYFRLGFENRVLDILPQSRRTLGCTFVGAFSQVHTASTALFEQAAKKTSIDFWGVNYHYLYPRSPIWPTYHGEAWGKDMYRILLSSKITLNRHNEIAQDFANNMRLYEATGCGALLLTDAKSNLEDIFKVGREVETYASADELVAKIKYYSRHPAAAGRIAKAGQCRTLSDHSYFHRMRELSRIMTRLLN